MSHPKILRPDQRLRVWARESVGILRFELRTRMAPLLSAVLILLLSSGAGVSCGVQKQEARNALSTRSDCPYNSPDVATGLYSLECVRSIVGESIALPDMAGYVAAFEIHTPRDVGFISVQLLSLEPRLEGGGGNEAINLMIYPSGPGRFFDEREMLRIDGRAVEFTQDLNFFYAQWRDGSGAVYLLMMNDSVGRSEFLKILERLMNSEVSQPPRR